MNNTIVFSQAIRLNTNSRIKEYLPRCPPGGITIKKSKRDITVICKKKGYEDAGFFNKSDVAGVTVDNILLSGSIDWTNDPAYSADNKYADLLNFKRILSMISETRTLEFAAPPSPF